MPVYSRKQLSGAPSGGLPVLVTATSQANAAIIHQVQATSTAARETLWLTLRSAVTNDAVARLVFDTATATGLQFNVWLSDRRVGANTVKIFEGLPLSGTDSIVRAYWATETGVLNCEGYYNQIATG